MKKMSKSEKILKQFEELEAVERWNFVLELCKRYSSLVCGVLHKLDKCDCYKYKGIKI